MGDKARDARGKRGRGQAQLGRRVAATNWGFPHFLINAQRRHAFPKPSNEPQILVSFLNGGECLEICRQTALLCFKFESVGERLRIHGENSPSKETRKRQSVHFQKVGHLFLETKDEPSRLCNKVGSDATITYQVELLSNTLATHHKLRKPARAIDASVM